MAQHYNPHIVTDGLKLLLYCICWKKRCGENKKWI